MMSGGTILGVVTLFLKEIHFDEHFVPHYASHPKSPYFYRNSTDIKAEYKRIEEDIYYPTLPHFRKCCPPGHAYRSEDRACFLYKGAAIYDELALKTDLLKSGLSECSVILDRFIEKSSLKRHDGNGHLLLMNETFTHYCLDNVLERGDFYVIRICKNAEYCTGGTADGKRDWCIRKCCSDGYGFENYQCVPKVDSGVRVEINKDHFERTDGYAVYRLGGVKCAMAHWINHQDTNFTIKTNGSLFNKGNEFKECYAYFFLSISRMTWLNVLSYEIWLTIGKLGIGIGLSKRSLHHKRKICYVIYAVLVPAITTIAFIVAHQKIHPLPEFLQPYIDMASCAIDLRGKDNNFGYLYLYIPITILTIINLVIFIKTLLHFFKMRNTLRRISDATSQHKQKMLRNNKKRGLIIFKLGSIMIVTWIYYLFSYLTRLTNHLILNTIGDILMFLNVFEGVYFFLIFIVKWRDMKRILYKIRILAQKDGEENAEESTSAESANEIRMHNFK